MFKLDFSLTDEDDDDDGATSMADSGDSKLFLGASTPTTS